jgi:hypothetical protein
METTMTMSSDGLLQEPSCGVGGADLLPHDIWITFNLFCKLHQHLLLSAQNLHLGQWETFCIGVQLADEDFLGQNEQQQKLSCS